MFAQLILDHIEVDAHDYTMKDLGFSPHNPVFLSDCVPKDEDDDSGVM